MRILSYNIQAAINSGSYTSYTYQWHRQFLPNPAKTKTLYRIADFIELFDVVCLQEIELGGLRNGFKSQALQLFEHTGFQYYTWQVNRRIGKLSIHGNLILSKLPLNTVINRPLPSRFPGRGLLAAKIINKEQSFLIANVHLSLGKLDQYRQLRFIRTQLSPHSNVILAGDFNCPPEAKQLQILTNHGYRLTGDGQPTYPTWNPNKSLDHIFVKGDIKAHTQVSDFDDSDHFPVILDIQ